MKRAKPRCAICWVNPKTGRAGTNSTTRICASCKRDPANVDWVESPREVPVVVAPQPAMTVDAAIRVAVRDVVRDVVRDEVRMALREELASVRLSSPANHDSEGYLSIGEAAKVARVHEATIRAWIGKGRLPGYRAGRHRRIKRSELDRCMGSLPDSDVVDMDKRAAELAAA
jgi:excisionase family DNA binding protein